jgi:hypothetical protein
VCVCVRERERETILIKRSTPPFQKLQSNSFGPKQLVLRKEATVPVSVYCGDVAVDSGDICVCATLMETHQTPMLNIYGVKQKQMVGSEGGGGICGDSEKVQTRDDMLNGAHSAEPLTASSKAGCCIHLCRRSSL